MEQYYWFCVFTAANAFLLTALGLNVSRLRITKKIPYGDGGDIPTNQAIRAHANGVEHVVIFGLNVLALSFMTVSATLMAGLVITFTASRFIHAYGMLFRTFNARRLGAGLTYVAELVAVIALVARVVAEA